jgi:hypothetical protein
MTKTFPKFASHAEVSCFNCEGDLIGDYVFSGHAQGGGEFVQHCEKCRMSTWYDIKARKAA